MSVITTSPSTALVGGHYDTNTSPHTKSDLISPDEATTVSRGFDAASRLLSAGGSQYKRIKADVAKHLYSEIFQGDGTGAGFDQAELEEISRQDRETFQQASNAFDELEGLKSQLRAIDQRTDGAVSGGFAEIFEDFDQADQDGSRDGSTPKQVAEYPAQPEGRELAGRPDEIYEGYDLSSIEDELALSSLYSSNGEASDLSTGWDKSLTGPEYKQVQGPPPPRHPEHSEMTALPERSQQQISYHMGEDGLESQPPSRVQRGISAPPNRSQMDFNALKNWYLTRVSRRTGEPKTMFDLNQTVSEPLSVPDFASRAPRAQPRTDRGYAPSAAPSQVSMISGAASNDLDRFFSFGGDAAQTIQSALQSGAEGEFAEMETEDGGVVTRGQASGVTADGRKFTMMVSKSVSSTMGGTGRSRAASLFGGPLTAQRSFM
ncbi:hypothetical protein I350_02290 [Cryptococcus amylolentus CBS 6273]|uniref:Uncharacterized protein n=1 Tax=Cryptococcus amylolentus CBS 6273 TaxID=1296118 RepID=A0A1E3KA47_9TREE|nr:hypothetical protein I350_02290 [Cryptococcus amylolentus CBS 6273]